MVTPFRLSSIYMSYIPKEGKRKSNDIKYAQIINKAKWMSYCRSSKLNGTKSIFFSDQLIKHNYGNVDYWIIFSKVDNGY